MGVLDSEVILFLLTGLDFFFFNDLHSIGCRARAGPPGATLAAHGVHPGVGAI